MDVDSDIDYDKVSNEATVINEFQEAARVIFNNAMQELAKAAPVDAQGLAAHQRKTPVFYSCYHKNSHLQTALYERHNCAALLNGDQALVVDERYNEVCPEKFVGFINPLTSRVNCKPSSSYSGPCTDTYDFAYETVEGRQSVEKRCGVRWALSGSRTLSTSKATHLTSGQEFADFITAKSLASRESLVFDLSKHADIFWQVRDV